MDWATIIPVLVGSGIALASSVSVEYLKYRQTTEVSRRESEDALRQQSREGLHVLVTEVQDSLEQMIMLASKLPGNRLSEEAAAALRMQFSNVTIGIMRLVSRLPDGEWRNSVKEVIGLVNQATEVGAPGGEADPIWIQATEKYEEVMDRIGEPLQKFYLLALTGTER